MRTARRIPRYEIVSLGCLLALAIPVPMGQAGATDTRDCTIAGTEGADVLIGTAGDDVICGFGGDDRIEAGDGDDLIFGGDGDDELRGDRGADELHGEDGHDALYGGDGNDVTIGGFGDDTMEGEGGDDSLTGEDGEDYADGGTGSDRCSAETVVSCEVFTMSALALLMADLESGLITVDEFSTLGLVWVFDPDQLPERYQTEYVPPDYGGIDEVTYEVNLFDQQPDLSAETRALIDDAWELTPDYEAAARLLMRGPPRHYNPSSSAAEELSGDDGTMPMGILILAVLAIASAALVGTWWMKRSKRH